MYRHRGVRPATKCVGLGVLFCLVSLVALASCSGGGRSSGPLTAEKVLAEASDALTDPEAGGLSSYRGKATLTGPTRDLERLGIAEELRVRTVEVSYRSPTHYRLLMRTEAPDIEAGEELLFIWDAETVWSFDSQLMEYAEYPSESGAYLQYRFNPALFAGGNIGNALEGLEEQGDVTAEIVREETVLGRDVYVVEVSPIVQSDADEDGDETPLDPASNVMRLWIDKENLFMLRLESPIDDHQGDIRLEYSEIEFNGEVPDSDFEFEPPPGAVLRDETDDNSTVSDGRTVGIGDFPPGFLNPSYRPNGYRSAGEGSSESSSGERLGAYSIFTNEGQDLVIQERLRRDGLPVALQVGERVDVNGLDAWLSDVDGARSLSWRQGELVVQITANALTPDELLRSARSMEEVP